MTGPAKAGLFIYAVDSQRIASFYQQVAGMTILHERDDLTVLQSPDIQLLIHRIPDQYAKAISISSPPEKREYAALKFFLTVDSLDDVNGVARALGGEVFEERWQGPGFIACNAMDPEGNVIQLRQATDQND